MRTVQSYSEEFATFQTQQSERQLVHMKDNMIIWTFPEDLERINDSDSRVHVDGTFRPAAYLPGMKQLVTLAVKYENADKSKVFCYRIADCLVPDKSQATYEALIKALKEIYYDKYGLELKIYELSCDQVII